MTETPLSPYWYGCSPPDDGEFLNQQDANFYAGGDGRLAGQTRTKQGEDWCPRGDTRNNATLWQGLKAHRFFNSLRPDLKSCPDTKREVFSSLFRRVPREPVAHHGKTVPQRLKPINLARSYGTAEAVPFVPTSPGAQFCGSPFGLVTVSTYPSCRRKRHFGRL